jgi:hypothetical protein
MLVAWCAKHLQANLTMAVAHGVEHAGYHGLLHGLKHLCLHSQHLLKSRWRVWQRVSILVVVLRIVLSDVGGDMIPCVGHLMFEH